MSLTSITDFAGGRFEEDLPFRPVRIAVLTVSDTRALENDTSGAVLAGRVEGEGHVLAGRSLVKDEVAAIRAEVTRLIDSGAAPA